MSRLKTGVIGLGEVAQVIHLPILEAMPDHYEIAAICDISEQLLEALGERYNVEHRYTNAEELVKQADLDVVFILNSTEYHAECAIQALDNGKHVFIEKPMCLTQREADEIIKARDRSGKQAIVGYMRRFAPAFLQAKEEIKKAGPINYVRLRDFMGMPRPLVEQTSHVYRFSDFPEGAFEDKESRFKAMVKEAIGVEEGLLASTYSWLTGLSSHDLSAMRELIGMPKRVISAAAWNEGRSLNVLFDYEQFQVAYEMQFDEQARHDAHIEVLTDHKTIRVQYDTPYVRQLPTHLLVHETVDGSIKESTIRATYKDPYSYELKHFYNVIHGTETPKTTPEDYKEDLLIFEMIIDALKG